MTASDHLDYPGRTVNLAARVADQSRSGDVVALCEVLDQADLSLVPGRGDITTESFTTRLRGLARDQHLVRLIIADTGRSAVQAGTGRPRRGVLPW
jgi:adenylate cyclase